MSFLVRAFTPGGGEAPEAVAQREAAQARINAEAAAKAATPPSAPTMPTVAPPSPPVFQPGQAPGQKQRAAAQATSILGAAAAAGQTSKKSLLGQ